jgi:hypothetical protein
MSRVAVVIAGTAVGTLLSHPLAAAPSTARGGLPAARREAQVDVRTYDRFGVAPGELVTALETVRAILSGASIDLVWRECGPCDDRPRPHELIVRIVAAPAEASPESLGYSLVDVRQRSGSLATIFAERVESLARAADVDPGVLLGRTIAHELAHLLIGTTEHSSRGLLRAHWSACELERDLQQDWVLSQDEGTRMRRGLAVHAPGLIP